MTLGPILRAKLAKYIRDYELVNMKEDDAFELFVVSLIDNAFILKIFYTIIIPFLQKNIDGK